MKSTLKTDFISKVEKINSELLSLTYGSLIVRLIKDYEKIDEINDALYKMGKNIGIRIIDDFLSKTGILKCDSIKETLENISTHAFKLYLSVQCELIQINEKEFNLSFIDNPLNDFVELPEKYHSLWFSNIIPGILVGALEVIGINVECEYIKDVLKGNDVNEIRLRVVEVVEEVFVDDE